MELFTNKGRSIENIPPTSAALRQHVLRAAYQAGYVWAQSTVLRPALPDATEWGWKLDKDVYHPFWTDREEAAKACYELIHCGCKNICKGRCKCVKSNLQSTSLFLQ